MFALHPTTSIGMVKTGSFLLVRLLVLGTWALAAFGGGAAAPAAAPPVAPARPVVVSGHLGRTKGSQVLLSYHYNILTMADEKVLTTRLDAAGNFRLVVRGLTQPIEAHFEGGEQAATLFLTPGDNLCLTVVGTRYPRALRYTGTGAAANTFLAKLGENANANLQNIPTGGSDTCTAPQMLARTAAFRQQQLDFLAAYAAAHPLPAVFKAYLRQRINFEQASYLLYDAEFRAAHSLLPKGEALPAIYGERLAALRPAHDSALAMNSMWYYNFLDSYSWLLPSARDTASTRAALAQVEAAFGTGRSRDLVLASYVARQLTSYHAGQLALLIARFRQLNRDSTLARLLRTRYVEALAFVPGHPAPGFALRDNTGKLVSLADLRGRVVYLSFWGTWCEPCLEELPASRALTKQFEGHDVVFVHISVDDEPAPWQRALAAWHLLSAASIHLRSPDHTVPDAYQPMGYPAYWLIDRAGRIVTTKAPRPSQGAETVAAIEQALLH